MQIGSGAFNEIRFIVTSPTAILLFIFGGIYGGMVSEIFNSAALLHGPINGISLLIGIINGFEFLMYCIKRRKHQVFLFPINYNF